MTIFQVLLIGGPLFFIAGILVLKFRNTASKRATSAQRSVYGYGRFGDNQVRGSTPDQVGAVGAFWILGGAIATIIALVHLLK